MFVPVYLQAHFLLKTIFCGIYVIFYRYNIVRVVILTAINISLLALNTFMKVCVFNILLQYLHAHDNIDLCSFLNTNDLTQAVLCAVDKHLTRRVFCTRYVVWHPSAQLSGVA